MERSRERLNAQQQDWGRLSTLPQIAHLCLQRKSVKLASNGLMEEVEGTGKQTEGEEE